LVGKTRGPGSGGEVALECLETLRRTDFVEALVELEAVAVSEVRSTKPTFGATRLGTELEADAPSESLDAPSAPHAARPNVNRLHNTTLRI